MKKIKLHGILLPLMILLLLAIGNGMQGCQVKSCEVRVTAGVIDCDDTNCPSPKKCVLQSRKKGTGNDWEDIAQPVENDPNMEYRCLCRD